MNLSRQFNDCSEDYRKYRPSYPVELFSWLSERTTEKNLAWDVGTGNGQAAIMLANHFDKVIATDVNPNQIKCAQSHPRVFYHCEPAEKVHLPPQSVDLITAASAVHWFDLKNFFQECRRVLKPEGIIALWSYTWPEAANAQVEQTLLHIKNELLGSYWSDSSLLHLNRYRELHFPFVPLSHPPFTLEKYWTVDELLYFLSTWATVQAYIKEVAADFMLILREKLLNGWPDEERIRFDFPIALRVGHINFIKQGV